MTNIVVISIGKNDSFSQTVEKYGEPIFVAKNLLFHVFNDLNNADNGRKCTNAGLEQLLDLGCL